MGLCKCVQWVWEAYILCIKLPDVCAKARCQAPMLSGKAHSVALFNVCYSHRRAKQKSPPTVALGQTGYCFAPIILSTTPRSLSPADATEFTGQDAFALPLQSGY